MAHKKGFIDYRLDGSTLEWDGGPEGTEISLHHSGARRSERRLGCVSLALFVGGGFIGAFWLVYLRIFRAIRRWRCRGKLRIDSLGIRATKTRLLRIKNLRWKPTDVLLLEPFTFHHRSFFGLLLNQKTSSIQAFRLQVVPLESLPQGDDGVDAAWGIRHTELCQLPIESDGYSGPQLTDGRWLQSFLHLEFALQVAHRLALKSGRPLIDATRAPKALVSTVEASAYDIESQGAVSLVSQEAAGNVSLVYADLDPEALQPEASVAPAELALAVKQPSRVRVHRRGSGSRIQVFGIRPVAIGQSLVVSAVGGGLWAQLWDALTYGHTLMPQVRELIVFVGFIVPPVVLFFGFARYQCWRHIVFHCDQERVDVVRSPDYPISLSIDWDDIFAMDHRDDAQVIRGGRFVESLRIRTNTALYMLNVPSGTGKWLLEELKRWCSRAAWKKRRLIDAEDPEKSSYS